MQDKTTTCEKTRKKMANCWLNIPASLYKEKNRDEKEWCLKICLSSIVKFSWRSNPFQSSLIL